MRILETYEDFTKQDNSKTWIVGIPSGEVFQVTREMIDDLFDQRLIHYSTQYVSTGFYAFLDKDIETIKKFIKPAIPKSKTKDITIEKNYFPESLVRAVELLAKEFEDPIELYVQDETMGITYGEYYLEITITPEGDGFELKQYHRGIVIDKYYVVSPHKLLTAVQSAMYDYD